MSTVITIRYVRSATKALKTRQNPHNPQNPQSVSSRRLPPTSSFPEGRNSFKRKCQYSTISIKEGHRYVPLSSFQVPELQSANQSFHETLGQTTAVTEKQIADKFFESTIYND